MTWRHGQLAGAGLHIRREQLGLSLEEIAQRARKVTRGNVNRSALMRWEKEILLRRHDTEIQHGWGYFSDRIVRMSVDDAYEECAHDVLVLDSLESAFPRLSTAKLGLMISLPNRAVHLAMMEPILMRMKPGQQTGARPERHSGEELIYVLEGQVRIEYESPRRKGTQNVRLGTGSLAHFRSEVPHRLVNDGPERVKLLLIKHPPDRYTTCTLRDACERTRRQAETQTNPPKNASETPRVNKARRTGRQAKRKKP